MTEISTPIEVITGGAFDKNFDPNLIAPFIKNAEYRHLASEESFFGESFYDALLADLRDFVVYKSDVEFDEDDVVLYNGIYYKCLVDGTTGVSPADVSKWEVISKFQTAKYQTLWNNHMQEFISFAVQHASTFKNAYRSTSKGIMRNEDASSKPAEYAGVKGLKDEIMAELMIVRERMDKFLRKYKTDYPLYKGNTTCTTSETKTTIGLYLKKTNRYDRPTATEG